MPMIPKEGAVPPPEVVYDGYYVRWLPATGGLWKYYIPKTEFEFEGRIWREHFGERSAAVYFFNEAVISELIVDGVPAQTMSLCFGGSLKKDGTAVDGGQVMRVASMGENRQVHVQNKWDPISPVSAPPPPMPQEEPEWDEDDETS